ncbi:MAG: hypothetical protein AAF488_17255 [Planctomycetota bacterium]
MKTQPGQEGLTLIECAVAIAVLATAIVTGLSLIEARYVASSDQGLSMVGAHLLTRELELVRSTPYEKVESRALSPCSVDSRFDTSWAVTDLSPGSRTVVVTVQWTAGSRTALFRGETTKTKVGP